MRYLLGITLIFSIGLAYSASDIPPKNKTIETKKQEEKAPAEQRGTEKNPVFIKSIPTEKSKGETDHQAYEHHEKPDLDRWLTRGTLALVGVTAVLAWFTFWLWRATGKLVIGADETAKRQLRAYVSKKAVKVNPIGPDDSNRVDAYDIEIIWENSGMTPARRCSVGTACAPFPNGIPDSFDFPNGDIHDGRSHLGPKQTVSGTTRIDSQSLVNAENGGYEILVWGWIEYTDIFDSFVRRRSETCFRLTTEGNAGIDNATFRVPHFIRFNGADEDCHHNTQTT